MSGVPNCLGLCDEVSLVLLDYIGLVNRFEDIEILLPSTYHVEAVLRPQRSPIRSLEDVKATISIPQAILLKGVLNDLVLVWVLSLEVGQVTLWFVVDLDSTTVSDLNWTLVRCFLFDLQAKVLQVRYRRVSWTKEADLVLIADILLLASDG